MPNPAHQHDPPVLAHGHGRRTCRRAGCPRRQEVEHHLIGPSAAAAIATRSVSSSALSSTGRPGRTGRRAGRGRRGCGREPPRGRRPWRARWLPRCCRGWRSPRLPARSLRPRTVRPAAHRGEWCSRPTRTAVPDQRTRAVGRRSRWAPACVRRTIRRPGTGPGVRRPRRGGLQPCSVMSGVRASSRARTVVSHHTRSPRRSLVASGPAATTRPIPPTPGTTGGGSSG
ncbi:hypothetical protein LX90_005165 [Lentzea flava]|nr:hypothetical protein [Lentzea flava]